MDLKVCEAQARYDWKDERLKNTHCRRKDGGVVAAWFKCEELALQQTPDAANVRQIKVVLQFLVDYSAENVDDVAAAHNNMHMIIAGCWVNS